MVTCGGAPLPTPLASAFHERYGFAPINTYGLTEAPTIVTDTCVGEAPEGSSGRVAPHLEVTIRDAEGHALSRGEVGEICLQPRAEGPWRDVYRLLLGYWGDAERNAGLGRHPCFATGDMGRFDADGWLFVVDRRSDLILRAGANIYPQEILRILERDPRVQACAVVGAPDERLGERTVAFVQPASPELGGERLLADLRQACRQELAKYKVPDAWVEVADFPRNAMGKIVLATLRRQATAAQSLPTP
jgi:acyl-CoA synthetase (AMP-forming)/AMP-acid ligase II